MPASLILLIPYIQNISALGGENSIGLGRKAPRTERGTFLTSHLSNVLPLLKLHSLNQGLYYSALCFSIQAPLPITHDDTLMDVAGGLVVPPGRFSGLCPAPAQAESHSMSRSPMTWFPSCTLFTGLSLEWLPSPDLSVYNYSLPPGVIRGLFVLHKSFLP